MALRRTILDAGVDAADPNAEIYVPSASDLDPELSKLLSLTEDLLVYSFFDEQINEQYNYFIKKNISINEWNSFQQKNINCLRAIHEPNVLCADANNPSITTAFAGAIKRLGDKFSTTLTQNHNSEDNQRNFIAYQNEIDALLKLVDSLVKYVNAVNQRMLANNALHNLQSAHVNQLQQELVALLKNPTQQAIPNYQDKIDDLLTSIALLAEYEKATKELIQVDPFFNEQNTQPFINLRKKQLLECKNREDIANLNNCIRSSTHTIQALTVLKNNLVISAREELAKPRANPVHIDATAVHAAGAKHAIELLQQPQMDPTYQETFICTLNNAAHIVKNKNKPANNIDQVQELHRAAKKLEGASGGYGKKFWCAIGQLVVGAIGFAVGILAEVFITIKTGGINIAFGGSPLWHMATASGALMLTGAATLFSNRQKGFSKVVSNLANTATAKRVEPKRPAASPAPVALAGRTIAGTPQPPASPPRLDQKQSSLSAKEAAAQDAGVFLYDPRADHSSPQPPKRQPK